MSSPTILTVRAEFDGRAAELADIDDVGERQQAFELLNPALVEALLLLGGVIFGVFAKIAVGAGFGNGGNDARAPLGRADAIFSVSAAWPAGVIGILSGIVVSVD